MADTKNIILKEAFKLFLSKNFEKVTVVDLENAIGMSRGAIFYYTKNKNILFKEVVDKYILSAQSLENKMDVSPGLSLLTYIYAYVDGVTKTMNYLKELTGNTSEAYYGLITQAIRYYPGFKDKLVEIFDKDYDVWIKIVDAAFQNGEIKENIDVKITALKFRCAYLGLAYEMSLKTGLDSNSLLSLLLSIYGDIKK